MIILYFVLIVVLIVSSYIFYILNFSGKKVDMRFARKVTQFDKKYSLKVINPIVTTLSGVRHNDCELVIIRYIRKSKILIGTKLLLIPDPLNLYDNTAIRVCTIDGWMLGWLPSQDWNNNIYYDLMNGKKWEATVKKHIKPSKEFNNHNLLIELWEYTEN